MNRPQDDACSPYFRHYIDQVPEGDFLANSDACFADSMATLDGLSEEQWNHRYEPGKWSVKELVGHVVDTERILSTRALVFARGETQDYPGFEQDDFIAATDFGRRSSTSILDEWRGLRAATTALRESLTDEELDRRGRADGGAVTPRALFWIIEGHGRHHMAILTARYLKVG